ncbi:MAG: NAD(P)/FAD-dependent oxidoreductase [Gemmatimonadaceae bacterium]
MAERMNGSGRPDVVVVGAGIVGAACAHALARDQFRVLVCEAAFPGGGTTAAGMGHIVVMDDSPAQLALTVLSRKLWTTLAPTLSLACEDERPGTLWIAATDEEMAAVHQKRALCERVGVRADALDGQALARAEPHLRPGLAGALFVPDDRVLYPPNAARWLLDAAVERGATVRLGASVRSIGAGAVTLTQGSGSETITTGAVVLATGIDAPQLVPRLGVVPRKGHLVITDRYPGLVRSQLVELGYLHSAHSMSGASTAFNVQPRPTGQLLIGSSRELVGRDATINPMIVHEMVARAVQFVPALGACLAIRTWTGFRPATADQLPLIGPWPEIPGLWIATGHEGLGITTATGTAAIVAAGIAGRTVPLDAAPFRPDRPMPTLEVA